MRVEEEKQTREVARCRPVDGKEDPTWCVDTCTNHTDEMETCGRREERRSEGVCGTRLTRHTRLLRSGSPRTNVQSMVESENFQHILRVLNTNIEGKKKVMYAMTSIKGIGRRFSNLICKKADVDMSKRCVMRATTDTEKRTTAWEKRVRRNGD